MVQAMDAEAARLVALGFGRGNTESLTELLGSFFAEIGTVIDVWAQAALDTSGPSELHMFKCAAPDIYSSRSSRSLCRPQTEKHGDLLSDVTLRPSDISLC